MSDVLERSTLEDDAPIDELEATEYSIETNRNDGSMRIQFHHGEKVLGTFITDAPGAYDFAQRVLRGYDILEGID